MGFSSHISLPEAKQHVSCANASCDEIHQASNWVKLG